MDVLTISACGRCLAVVEKLIRFDERASQHSADTCVPTVLVLTSARLVGGDRVIRITDDFLRTRAWFQFESRSYALSGAGFSGMLQQPGNQLPPFAGMLSTKVVVGTIHTPAHQPKISGTTSPCSTILMGLPMGLMCSCSGSIFNAWQNVLNRSGMEKG
jgi:hypothetical protein